MIFTKNTPPRIVIIGGGISGISLALRFLEKGITPTVIDNGNNNSSKVAAGLWNPLVFKRLSPSWMVNRLLEELYQYYPKAEKLLDATFFHPMPIYKFINDENELKMWQLKQNDADLYDLTNPNLKKIDNGQYHHKLGYCTVLKSGFVNIPKYLEAAKIFLISRNAFLTEDIDYQEFELNDSAIKFRNFDLILFAEGKNAIKNPFFNSLNFNLCKGDIITFSADLSINDAVVNNEGFIVPLGDNLYKIGSSYVWNDLSETPNMEGYNKMIDKLNRLINVPYEVLKHEVGVRPTTQDRKPVLGFHPEIKNAYIFNGMGTKGILLTPYFSKITVEHILSQSPLNQEITYTRNLS